MPIWCPLFFVFKFICFIFVANNGIVLQNHQNMSATFWKDFDHFYESVEKRVKEKLGQDFEIGEFKETCRDLFCFSESVDRDRYYIPTGLLIYELKRMDSIKEYKYIVRKYKAISENKDLDRIKKRIPLFKNKVKVKDESGTESIIPDKPGVYFLFNRHKEIIYIGKSKSLRNRALTSFNAQGAEFMKIIVTQSVADANFLEPYFISLYAPPKNKALKTEDKPSIVIQLPEMSDFIDPKSFSL